MKNNLNACGCPLPIVHIYSFEVEDEAGNKLRLDIKDKAMIEKIKRLKMLYPNMKIIVKMSS